MPAKRSSTAGAARCWRTRSRNVCSRAGKAPTNFARTLPSPQSDLARELLADPSDFEFLGAAAE